MYKSAYKVGLYLMASLTVLSALVIPMDNMNLFSDVMASGKNHDKYDNYQEYEKSYYSDDKQYAPDYNYYYEPMKQQQQPQSSYDNNINNYGYDDTKQISYNNSYEDIKNIVHILQKTRNMSVKLDSLKVSLLNLLNS